MISVKRFQETIVFLEGFYQKYDILEEPGQGRNQSIHAAAQSGANSREGLREKELRSLQGPRSGERSDGVQHLAALVDPPGKRPPPIPPISGRGCAAFSSGGGAGRPPGCSTPPLLQLGRAGRATAPQVAG